MTKGFGIRALTRRFAAPSPGGERLKTAGEVRPIKTIEQ
jgi:hypothetical protein